MSVLYGSSTHLWSAFSFLSFLTKSSLFVKCVGACLVCVSLPVWCVGVCGVCGVSACVFFRYIIVIILVWCSCRE